MLKPERVASVWIESKNDLPPVGVTVKGPTVTQDIQARAVVIFALEDGKLDTDGVTMVIAGHPDILDDLWEALIVAGGFAQSFVAYTQSREEQLEREQNKP